MWDFSADKESSFEPIPAGTYNLLVDKVEEKLTKNNDKRLAFTFSVLDGQYQGRKIFEGYNMTGSEQAVQIARGQLKSLLKAGGRPLDIQGAHDFVGIEIAAAVKVQPAKDGYDARNSISSFKAKVSVEQQAGAVPF